MPELQRGTLVDIVTQPPRETERVPVVSPEAGRVLRQTGVSQRFSNIFVAKFN